MISLIFLGGTLVFGYPTETKVIPMPISRISIFEFNSKLNNSITSRIMQEAVLELRAGDGQLIKSIISKTVLNQSKSSEQDSVREVAAHDGVKGRLTDKSTNHLTSKHGDVLGIDDPLPPNPNQKPTKYKQIRTRVNKENKEKFGDIVEEILKDSSTEPYPDVSMRGIKGHGYYTENYGESGFFVGIHNEGEFAGQIKKAQPISDQQLKTLQEENRMD